MSDWEARLLAEDAARMAYLNAQTKVRHCLRCGRRLKVSKRDQVTRITCAACGEKK